MNKFELKGVTGILNSKQQKCICLMVSGAKTQKQIANELRVSEATICNWKKTTEFTDEYISAIKSSIKDVAAKAFKVEEKLLSAKSEMVRLMAAKDILDRAGLKPEDNVNLNGNGVMVIIDGGDELAD